MSQDWLKAIKSYQLNQKREGRRSFFTLKNQPTENIHVIEPILSDLNIFLNSREGTFAFTLLQASNRYIVFGEDETGMGYNKICYAYYMNETGLYLSATGLPYEDSAQTERQTQIRSITRSEAIHAAITYGRKKPEEVMPWLRAELDTIAAAAPEPTPIES